MKKESLLYFLLAALLCVVFYFLFQLRYQSAPPVFLYVSFFMFATLSFFNDKILGPVVADKAQDFVQRYMGLTAVKMFLILSVLTIYLWFNKEHLFAVGLTYAGAYLLFLIVDTVVLLKRLKAKN